MSVRLSIETLARLPSSPGQRGQEGADRRGVRRDVAEWNEQAKRLLGEFADETDRGVLERIGAYQARARNSRSLVSVFLVIVETGRAVPPTALPSPLAAFPVQIRPYGAGSSSRPGLAIGDGVMRTKGAGATAHAGEKYRRAVLEYVRTRLIAHRVRGTAPAYTPIHLAFLTIAGTIVEATLDLGNEGVVGLSQLEERLLSLQSEMVIGVVEDT